MLPEKSFVSASDDELGDTPGVELHSRHTICLGDMPSNQYDETPCYDEKKTSTESNIYSGVIIAGQVERTGSDEIEVNLRITETG